ncbi:MAG: carboxy terminal-processing peptidase [Gammaproteobacteria bacterium]|jgi:carboxyl-terminal processing protease|nr:carboxy terminal-processing peptidase [Gammaproteobacteria bacterium]
MTFGFSRTRAAIAALLVGLLVGSAAVGDLREVSAGDLKPTKSQRQATVILTKVVDKFHYRRVPLDDAMSEKILKRYLESLDPNRSFLSQKDVDGFAAYRHKLDDALRAGDLDPAFKIFQVFRQRVDERTAYALQLLKGKFDFTVNERYEFDREKSDWVRDRAALDDLWRKRVKNDALSLRLAGKSDDEIRDTLRKRYEGVARRTRQFTGEDVFQTFANAYTVSIEPHTGYMSPRTSENFDISMRLSLEGIGAVLRSENENTVVQRTVPGGPAALSGQVHAGDTIVGVGQGDTGEVQDVVGWRLQDVVDQIRGPKGSTVRLQVVPKGMPGPPREVVLERNAINLEDQAAKSSIVEGRDMGGMRIGVIRIPGFYRDFRGQADGDKEFRSTTRDVKKLLAELKRKGVDGVVIDLRHNGGGSLSEATELTGLFIGKGPVVQIKDTSGRVEVEEDAEAREVYSGPLAVLVDRDSASASEIFAGAIQDYRRGIILGEPTFGKGTVQTLIDLNRFVDGDEDYGRLRLTMAQFFRVSGGSTQHRGVVPDIVFPTASSADDHGERAFDNALPWASIAPAKFRPVGQNGVSGLVEQHQERTAHDPGFVYLHERETELEAVRQQRTVSLLESERRKEYDQRKKRQLDARNAFRKTRGLAPLTQAQVDAEEEPDPDEEDAEGVSRILVEESARILGDYVRTNQSVRAAQLY